MSAFRIPVQTPDTAYAQGFDTVDEGPDLPIAELALPRKGPRWTEPSEVVTFIEQEAAGVRRGKDTITPPQKSCS